MNNSSITIPLIGRIDSNNAQAAEREICSVLAASDGARPILDASELAYISSAGLRVLLRLRQEHNDLSIINVNSEVYEILEMTGFTEMIRVERAYRVISVDNCEQIGRGANGAVYRLDNENVVKVYNDSEALDDIRREREKAKLALILGIPTAISYEIVRIGESYGSVFELLNARSFSEILASEPQSFDRCVNEFASLLKLIHSTVVPEGKLPEYKPYALTLVSGIDGMLTSDEQAKLNELVRAIPDSSRMIHGDYHTKNLMEQNGEVLVIDMDTLSVGDPIFDIASIYNAFLGFSEYDSEVIKKFQGFDRETGEQFFKAALKAYLDTGCEAKLREVEDKARILSYTRLIERSVRHGGLETEKGRAEIELWKSNLSELLSTADTLSFALNELEVDAVREALPDVLGFIEERTEKLCLPVKTSMQMAVVAEEIFVNIADYAYAPGRGKATVRVETDEEAGEAVITFIDGGAPSDPTKKQDPDITLPAGERELGGLGIFIAKKFSDDFRYEYMDGKNVLSFRKKL